MTDSSLNRFIAAGTAADRAAYTPSPPTPASGAAQGYFWHETDTGDSYSWKAGTGWIKVNGIGTGPSTSLSQISSSLSGAISSTASLSSAVSTTISTTNSTNVTQSTSLSQISSSLSGAIANIDYTTTVTATGTPPTNAVGYLGAPQNIGLDSGNVALALTDAGKSIYHSDANARDLTIPANGSVAFPVGTIMMGVNGNAAGVVTMKITTDTLRWGTSTGQRTIAANASWTLYKELSTTWRLTGDGIT